MSESLDTTAIQKIQALNKPIKGIQGGTSAGKTFGILPILIEKAIHNKVDISVVSESIPHLKRGAIKDFKTIMNYTDNWIQKHWNGTDFKYTFGRTNSTIEFFSASEDGKLRGARRDVLYMNEANNLTFHAYTELASRTKGEIFLDWNPTSSFWFHEELLGDIDVDFLTINYLDNEGCPERAKEFILKAKEKAKTSKYWENWYRVYGLGEIGTLEGVIFSNWTKIDSIPNDARLISRGLDFGYTNDPTACIDIYKYNDKLILDELIYETKLLNSDIIRRLKQIGNKEEVYTYADSAEPKSIEEIKRAGIKIKGATKGKDSINYGIDFLQKFELLITNRSTNLIKELRNYSWDTDKEGNSINKPIDNYNHCIDATRYGATAFMKPKVEYGGSY